MEKTIIDPAPVKACPQAWRRIGAEVSEQLDYQPGKFFRRLTIRPKYVRIAVPEKVPIIAKLPAKRHSRHEAEFHPQLPEYSFNPGES